ncbi:hypothetical protein UlMin_042125 [Ulmus minor]
MGFMELKTFDFKNRFSIWIFKLLEKRITQPIDFTPVSTKPQLDRFENKAIDRPLYTLEMVVATRSMYVYFFITLFSILSLFLSSVVFSFWLNCNAEREEWGEIVCGGVDSDHFKGNHTYVPVTHKGFYGNGCKAITDLGTSLLAGPETIITQFNHDIRASSTVSQECKIVVSQYGKQILELLLAQPSKICSQIACEMVVVWMQNQLKRNETEDEILNYINELLLQLYERLPSPNGEAVDCRNLSSLHSVLFTARDTVFDLVPEEYDLKVGDGVAAYFISGFIVLDVAPPCGPLFTNLVLCDAGFWEIFSWVAITRVFDFGNMRVGFTEAA